jgi:hypothetical protein
MTPFTVEVSYRLSEYLSVVWEYAPTALVKHARAKQPAAEPKPFKLLLGRLVGTAFSVPMFFYKVSRVGRCHFQFTESGVTRKSKMGELQTPWAEVKHVRVLRKAFLIVKERGAMPVPYRCMSQAQHEWFRSFAANLNVGGHVA